MDSVIKVLVADDDKQIVRTTCDILRIKGFRAVGAHSGGEAVAAAERERPDCVLMDVMMPGMNGVEALKRMRSSFPNLPILLMTAFASEQLIAEARAHGVAAVLAKPLDVETVLSFVALLRANAPREALLADGGSVR